MEISNGLKQAIASRFGAKHADIKKKSDFEVGVLKVTLSTVITTGCRRWL